MIYTYCWLVLRLKISRQDSLCNFCKCPLSLVLVYAKLTRVFKCYTIPPYLSDRTDTIEICQRDLLDILSDKAERHQLSCYFLISKDSHLDGLPYKAER